MVLLLSSINLAIMHRVIFLVFISLLPFISHAQHTLILKVKDAAAQPLPHATVELWSQPANILLKMQVTDSAGGVKFEKLPKGNYVYKITHSSYAEYASALFLLFETEQRSEINLQPDAKTIAGVTVSAQKPLVEFKAGKTIVNLDASPASVGATALEALEKMPGITIDKDGNISLKGRTGVLVLIDGKQTFLDAAQLATLLGGMSAAQLSQVEIMDQPSARYDAAGNAGVINIKTKTNLQKGFNASVTSAYTQGFYPKNNNSFQLNYRIGKWHLFTNYSANFNTGFVSVYALRNYLPLNGTPALTLDQPSRFKSNSKSHNLRSGISYIINNKTTAGITLNGLLLDRKGSSLNNARWLNDRQLPDSVILTRGRSTGGWEHGGANLNFRHQFNKLASLQTDIDIIGYRMSGTQFFENNLQSPNGYSEAIRANLPASINILSAKADYEKQGTLFNWSTGLKSSRINTDNLAAYEIKAINGWETDPSKTNHFIYQENIHALYGTIEMKKDPWTIEAGLRYEATAYDASQVGNSMQKDSSFSRSYDGLFPNLLLSFNADSNHNFSFTAGRRIDRPAFQKLNPFIQIINKYTYQQGNPYFRPQYTWNMQWSHTYKNQLVTSFAYSITTDYFSQIFPIDSNGLVVYTEGNLDKLIHYTFTTGVQFAPAPWWQLNAQIVLTYKEMEGFVGKALTAEVMQGTINLQNNFKIRKGWSAELSGIYNTRSQSDIQEIVDPSGQLSVGVAKSVLQNKGSVKLALRDLFYTQWMKGNTFFPGATEYFKVTRDTRVAAISFNYRFGKTFKTNTRSDGSAGEEKQRVGM